MKSIKLFCIPYAGASATIYYKFRRHLDEKIELCPIEFSGRGMRGDEVCLSSFDETVEDIASQIIAQIREDEIYAIFGYSLGALVAYEVVYVISKVLNKKPVSMFLAAYQPPNIINKTDSITNLSDDELIIKLAETGGISAEVLEDKEILKPFLQIIRSDFNIINTYGFKNKDKFINSKTTILFTKEDSHSERIKEWDNVLSVKCKYREFKGDHFFINREYKKITEIINSELRTSL